jgi:LmeA-like phospholipid-binding
VGRLAGWARPRSVDTLIVALAAPAEKFRGKLRRAELRKLIVTLVIVVVIAVAVLVGDGVAVHWSEGQVASRIERSFPGSHATVTISSSLYLPRLALLGRVQEVHAHVTDVTDGRLHLDAVDVTAHNLSINRADLLHGDVRVDSLSTATITTTIGVSEALQAAGYEAGSGLTGLTDGLKANLQAGSGEVRIEVGPLTFSFAYNSLVPCVGSGVVSGGEIILTCTTHTVPAALRSASVSQASGATSWTVGIERLSPLLQVGGPASTARAR